MSPQVRAMWIKILCRIEIANIWHLLTTLLRAPIIDPRGPVSGLVNTAVAHEATHWTVVDLFTDDAVVPIDYRGGV